ncbi:13455_t:CDS:2 [Cetraspora pellucida]|uniref:13455_t:CDS:1 n=1 Tax=Cetraspora pellucida TaxID=1433469 RepID=A0ACA9KLK6_9GLOM|nr:13455_t:CDS:2 [Cetraspora pellucida]
MQMGASLAEPIHIQQKVIVVLAIVKACAVVTFILIGSESWVATGTKGLFNTFARCHFDLGIAAFNWYLWGSTSMGAARAGITEANITEAGTTGRFSLNEAMASTTSKS